MVRMPFCDSLGVAATRDPSPRKTGPSSVLLNCEASRIVKGRTRTATVIEAAPSSAMVFVGRKESHFSVEGWKASRHQTNN